MQRLRRDRPTADPARDIARAAAIIIALLMRPTALVAARFAAVATVPVNSRT